MRREKNVLGLIHIQDKRIRIPWEQLVGESLDVSVELMHQQSHAWRRRNSSFFSKQLIDMASNLNFFCFKICKALHGHLVNKPR